MKKLFGPLVLAFILLVVITQVNALGVMPSSQRVFVGEPQTYTLKIVNNDKLDFTALLDIQGDLAEYITINRENIKFDAGTEIERVIVTIDIPKDLSLSSGDHENYIIIKQEISNAGKVEATINLAAKIDIHVPYDDEALEIKLYSTNFEKNKQNNFVIEIKNMGSKDINGAIPILEIYSPTNDKLQTLNGDSIDVEVGQKVLKDMPWTPDLPNGKYYAKAFVIYGEKTATVDKVFSIGLPEILIDSITTNTFRLGGIASLDLIISSTWVEPIKDIFASVELLKDSKTIYETKTVNKDISSLGKTNLPIFIDTKGFEPGKYDLSVTLNYLGISKTELFELLMESDSISLFGASGNVVAQTDKEGSGISLLIVIVLILVILNGIVVYKFVILKKKKE